MTDSNRIKFLCSLHEFHVNGGYDAGDPVTIQEVIGNINDREYIEIGKGETFLEAIDNAIRRAKRQRKST